MDGGIQDHDSANYEWLTEIRRKKDEFGTDVLRVLDAEHEEWKNDVAKIRAKYRVK